MAGAARRLHSVPGARTPDPARRLLPPHRDRQRAHARGVEGALPPRPVAAADHAGARAGAGGVAARRRRRGSGCGWRSRLGGSRRRCGSTQRGSTCGGTWWRCSTDDELLARGEFDARADAALSTPLDRSHPLWEIHLAPRLEDGSVGLVMKIHHAMVDGKSALAVALLLLDLDPNAPEPAPPAEAWAGDRAPGPARLAVEALVESGAEPLRALGRAARAASSPPRLGGTLRRAALAVGEDVARSAPSSFLNPAIGPRRTLVGHTVARAAAARRQARVGRLAQRRRAHGRGGRAPTARSAATRGAGADEGDGSRVAAGRATRWRTWATGSPSCSSTCRCTCATRSRGSPRSARRPWRSRTASGRPAARR